MTKPRRPPECGYSHDGRSCRARGDHLCRARVAHVLAFFGELLHHTKGDYVRRPFEPADWQKREILSPLFGRVRWDGRRHRYVRQYRVLYLSTPRKNGKSEMLAALCLYLLCADDEEAAEIYGLALDRDQAGHVYRAAQRMVRLSPQLAARLDVIPSVRRIVDEHSASFFSVMSSDAAGNLGASPHGAYIDELLTQPSRDLYDAVRTGMGARAQPLLLLATTAEADPSGFAAGERETAERVAADPSLDPTKLVVIHRADADADFTDRKQWRKANPALGAYLDPQILAAEARSALNNPAEERAFKQYRLNLPVNAIGRAIDLVAWDRSAGLVNEEELAGRRCFGGLDLASTTDLAAFCLDFPDDDGTHRVIWRLFCPSAALDGFSRRTGGQAEIWARLGLLEATEGDVIDYQAIRSRMMADAARFEIVEVAFDRWGATQLTAELAEDGLQMVAMGQGFASMSAPTKELLRQIAAGSYRHGGNPALRWQASQVVCRSDPAGNLKIDKSRSADKVDGLVAAVMALDRASRHVGKPRAYGAVSF